MGVAEGDGDGFGVALGSFGAGVGVVDGEEERGFLLAERVEAVGFNGGHVNDGDLLLRGELVLIVAETHIAFDVEDAVGIVDPDIADGDSEEERRGFFRTGVGDVSADVPAVGVDGFNAFAGEGAGGEGLRRSVLDGLVADAFDAGAGFGVGLGMSGATVIVAHLDEDEVAGLHFGEDVGPEGFVVVAAGAAAGAGTVGDVDLGGVEVVGEVIAPAEVGLIACGGVADDEEGRESRVERGVLGDAGLGWGVGSGGALGEGRCGEEKNEAEAGVNRVEAGAHGR